MILLWILVLALLVANAVTLSKLIEARRITQQAVVQATELLATLEDLTIEQTVAIQQDIPIVTEVTIDETLSVPVQTDLEVDQDVTIPIQVGGLGIVDVTIPIQTTLPIDMTIDVPFQIAMPIDMTFPVDLQVPISIDLSDTALYGILQEAQVWLSQIAEYLADSIFP
jgi:hypothetical protein